VSAEDRRGTLSLVLAGGGITGAMYEFGALQALDHFFSGAFRVNDFDIFVGTSGGAVVAALMANRVPPGDVGRAIIHNTDSPLNFKQDHLETVSVRARLSKLAGALGKEGEVLITRRGKAIARLLPVRSAKTIPSHAALRRCRWRRRGCRCPRRGSRRVPSRGDGGPGRG